MSTTAFVNPAPRLLAAGIDVLELSSTPLPAELFREVEKVALRSRREIVRWELTCGLTLTCHERLARGDSVAEITDWLRSPAVRRLLRCDIDIRSVILESGLPTVLCERVDAVRSRLAWWLPGRLTRRERNRAVVEYCAALAGALRDGADSARLTRVPLSQTLRDLRRSQLRRRWWISRMFRMVRLTCVWCLLTAFLAWGLLFARLIIAQPEAQVDFLERFDAQNRLIAEGDRAWPLIRDAHIQLGAVQTADSIQMMKALMEGPADPDWPRARVYLQQQEPIVELLVQASKKPHLGRLYRDPKDQHWFQIQGYQSGYPASVTAVDVFQIPLLQTNAYSKVILFLQGRHHLAIENQEWDRAMELLEAQIRLQTLIACAPDFPMVQSTGTGSALEAGQTALKLVEQNRGRFSAPRLAGLADAVAKLHQAHSQQEEGLAATQVSEDTLSSLFSPGKSGRVTLTGLRMMRLASMNRSTLVPLANWLGSPKPSATPPFSPPQDWCLLTGPLVAPIMLTRGEVESQVAELSTLRDLPLDADVAVDYDTALARLSKDDFSTIRNSPLICLLSVMEQRGQLAGLRAVSTTAQTRLRTALVRIALERFRLRTGAFPMALSDLVPLEIDELPTDPVAESPLRYRLVGETPLLYSVGLDRVDQTAALELEPGAEPRVDEADTLLSPGAPDGKR